MPVIRIPTDRISDWSSFHDVFVDALGFPSYYGRNMAAWVDCLTYADDLTAGMIALELIAAEGDILTLSYFQH
jgi:RNAse (barnase) inhibitor barstar